MPDIVNPYIPGQPVDTPELFFGRRDILTSVREHVLKGRRVFVVSSPPRMGKSSLLRQLRRYLPEEFVSSRLDLAEEEAKHLDSMPGACGTLLELVGCGGGGQQPETTHRRPPLG